jgi:hypothetical protein
VLVGGGGMAKTGFRRCLEYVRVYGLERRKNCSEKREEETPRREIEISVRAVEIQSATSLYRELILDARKPHSNYNRDECH